MTTWLLLRFPARIRNPAERDAASCARPARYTSSGPSWYDSPVWTRAAGAPAWTVRMPGLPGVALCPGGRLVDRRLVALKGISAFDTAQRDRARGRAERRGAKVEYMHMQLFDKGRCICMHLELDIGRQEEDKFYQSTPITFEQYVCMYVWIVCVASAVATHVTLDY